MESTALTLALCVLGTMPAVPHSSPAVHSEVDRIAKGDSHLADAEFEKRFAAAEGDAAALWKLYRWCVDTSRDTSAKQTLRAVIKADTDHLEARKALGHQRHNGRWYTSQKSLDKALAKERDANAKARGLVKHKGEWVEPGDLPFLEQGLIRGPEGDWVTPEDAKRMEEGWVRQDLIWISPGEQPKMQEGLWKCGEDWLSLEDADKYHNRFSKCWVIPSEHLELWTSCPRKTALEAIDHLERCYRDLVKVYGMAPLEPVRVALFRSSDQMGFFGAEAARGRPAADGRRLIEALSYSFMESWVVDSGKTYLGAGASFWDTTAPNGDLYGVHAARMAFGLSFSDAMDPSKEAVATLQKKGYRSDYVSKFYKEKTVPAWFSWGAASYGSRYFEDNSVKRNGDPWWTRKWAVDNLKKQGGLTFLGPIFDMELSPSNRSLGTQVSAAGLLVSFIVDGGCSEVTAIHGELKAALREGKKTKDLFGKLQDSIENHEDELRAFAGL